MHLGREFFARCLTADTGHFESTQLVGLDVLPPDDEAHRLQALHSYRLADTEPEPAGCGARR